MPTTAQGAQLNIANGIREFAIATPGAIAVIDGERRLTYAALNERASRLANARPTQNGETYHYQQKLPARKAGAFVHRGFQQVNGLALLFVQLVKHPLLAQVK